jgi:hypothetical protein
MVSDPSALAALTSLDSDPGGDDTSAQLDPPPLAPDPPPLELEPHAATVTAHADMASAPSTRPDRPRAPNPIVI